MLKPLMTADIFESVKICAELVKTCEVIKSNCEPLGLADYNWNYGLLHIWERKQAGELLSCMWGRLDVQLTKYRAAHPEAIIGIIQEGMISPDQEGKCVVWRGITTKGKRIMVPQATRAILYSSYIGYINQRLDEGFRFITTYDEMATASTLSSMIYNDMSTIHSGLKSHVVKKFDPLIIETRRDSWKNKLSTDKGIGDKIAEGLLDKYGTPWSLYSQSYNTLYNLEGERIAKIIFNGIGKDSTS
jgi:ERCC4-type nuclease